MAFMDDFINAAHAEFGNTWWTAAEALERVPLDSLPAEVQICLQEGGSASKSLGKMLAARRGPDLQSGGSRKKALRWKVSRPVA